MRFLSASALPQASALPVSASGLRRASAPRPAASAQRLAGRRLRTGRRTKATGAAEPLRARNSAATVRTERQKRRRSRRRFANRNRRRPFDDRRIEIGAVEMRIDIGPENIGVDDPGTAQHQAGDGGAAEKIRELDFRDERRGLGHREIKTRTRTGTHPPCIQTGPTLFPFQAALDDVRSSGTFERWPARDDQRKFPQSISQRCGASLRRLLVKCGLSEGGCWAWVMRARIPTGRAPKTPDSVLFLQ